MLVKVLCPPKSGGARVGNGAATAWSPGMKTGVEDDEAGVGKGNERCEGIQRGGFLGVATWCGGDGAGAAAWCGGGGAGFAAWSQVLGLTAS